MRYLRQSTATSEILGPFLDSVDGVTPETGINAAATDIDLYKGVTKSDITDTDSGGSNDFAHVANGYYSLELTAGDTDTLGNIRLTINATGCLPIWEDFTVLSQQVFDSLISGADLLQVDIQAMADNVIAGSKIATDAVTKIQLGLASAADLAVVDVIVDAILLYTGQVLGPLSTIAPVSQTSFGTGLVGLYPDDVFLDRKVRIDFGSGISETRDVLGFDGTTGVITLDEDFIQTLTAGLSFVILDGHDHPVTQIGSAAAAAILMDAANKLLTNASGHVTPVATADDAVLAAISSLSDQVSDLVAGPDQTIVISDGDCAEVQQFDIGEIKPVTARLAATNGTFTISSVTVRLEDADATAVYGLASAAATGFDAGALTSPRAWYTLNTTSPPSGGPIAAGAYNMIFTFVGTTSDGISRTHEIHITILVE